MSLANTAGCPRTKCVKAAMPNFDLTETFLPFSAVQATTGLSRSTIYEKISQGTFPAPIKIGRASRWSMIELRAWMDLYVRIIVEGQAFNCCLQGNRPAERTSAAPLRRWRKLVFASGSHSRQPSEKRSPDRRRERKSGPNHEYEQSVTYIKFRVGTIRRREGSFPRES